METATRFDLTAALATWRQELSAQPALTADHLRELETHLNLWINHSGTVVRWPIDRVVFQLMGSCWLIAIAAWLLPVPAPKPSLASV